MLLIQNYSYFFNRIQTILKIQKTSMNIIQHLKYFEVLCCFKDSTMVLLYSHSTILPIESSFVPALEKTPENNLYLLYYDGFCFFLMDKFIYSN